MKVVTTVLVATVFVAQIIAIPTNFILNGQPATEDKLHAVIVLASARLGDFRATFGGGSIISPRHILTAAHLCINAREFRIGYGDIRARNIIRLTANTALIHGQFNQATLENDLAIISLRNGQTFNENIAKVVPIARYSPPMSREGFVASFGFTSNNLKTISERLMVARQIIIPNADCSKVFGRPVHRNQFCAQDQPPQPPADEPIEDEDEEEDQDEDDESPDSGGDADDSADDGLDPGLPGFDWGNFGRAITPRREEVVLTGVCRGDTGSAVVFQVDERYVAYGLVSRVPRGCNNNQPALYTDLTSFTQWIEDATLGAATILRV